MLTADDLVKFGFGFIIGGAVVYFWMWAFARKVDALVPGGLKAWDAYDLEKDKPEPAKSTTGRLVTE